MFDRMGSAIPQITVGAVVSVAIFNIGYFSKLGIHFLGVMDISNIVYSFGLIFGLGIVLVQFLQGFALVHLFNFVKRPTAKEVFWRFSRRVLLPALICLSVVMLLIASRLLPPQFLPEGTLRWDAIIAFYFALILSWGMVSTLVNYHLEPKGFVPLDIATTIIVSISLVFYVGRAVAAYEAFDNPFLYQLAMKNNITLDVRIVRSSSMGFIVVENGFLLFLPRDQVFEVRSKDKIKM